MLLGQIHLCFVFPVRWDFLRHSTLFALLIHCMLIFNLTPHLFIYFLLLLCNIFHNVHVCAQERSSNTTNHVIVKVKGMLQNQPNAGQIDHDNDSSDVSLCNAFARHKKKYLLILGPGLRYGVEFCGGGSSLIFTSLSGHQTFDWYVVVYCVSFVLILLKGFASSLKS